jgi:hypothetical protein
MENKPLQHRAGRNIGNQALPPYIHGAGMPEIPVSINGSTVIMEGQQKTVRTPCVRSDSETANTVNFGRLFNTTDISYDASVHFIDNANNEIQVGGPTTVLPNDDSPLELNVPFGDGAFLGLCYGEKLVLRCVITPEEN